MRRTEHLSGGVAWPARDLYLADDGECPACRKTFDGVEPTRNLATAAIWYEVAVEHGDEIAAERLEELRAETRDIFKGMRFV